MRTILIASRLLPLLALAACDPVLFSAELDAPEVCLGGLTVPFAPSEHGSTTEQMLSSGDLGLPDWDDLDLMVAVRSVGVTPTDGVDDLGFLDALRVSAASAAVDNVLPDLMVVEMDRSDHMSDGAMYSEPDSPVDLADHLRAGDVLFHVEIAGDMPEVVWQAGMDLCVHTDARYRKPI